MLDAAAPAQVQSNRWFRRSAPARRAALTTALFLVLVGQAFFPMRLTAAPRWLKVRSPHFELLTSAGEADGSDLVVYLEQIRSFLTPFLGSATMPSDPVHVIGFQSDKDFNSFSPSEYSAAFYVGAPTGDYIVLKHTAGLLR